MLTRIALLSVVVTLLLVAGASASPGVTDSPSTTTVFAMAEVEKPVAQAAERDGLAGVTASAPLPLSVTLVGAALLGLGLLSRGRC